MTKIDVAELRQRYADIMAEIKDRMDVVVRVCGDIDRLPRSASQEMAYLQLRMMCELIAHACFAAHGEMQNVQTKAARDAYEPNAILKHLERLHPLYYPIPASERLDTDGGFLGITPLRENPLPKADLVKLYGMCGDVLHVGPPSKLQRQKNWDPKEAANWQNRMIALLNRHIIVLADRKRMIYVTMQDELTKRVTVSDLTLTNASRWPNWFTDLQNQS